MRSLHTATKSSPRSPQVEKERKEGRKERKKDEVFLAKGNQKLEVVTQRNLVKIPLIFVLFQKMM